MNRIYRTVFNRALGVCQAVSELTSSASKRPGARRARQRNTIKVLSALMLLAPLSNAQADILGGNYTGSQTFYTGNNDVTQSSAIIASDDFSVLAGTGNITLDNAANVFSGDTTLQGNNVAIASASGLMLSASANSLRVQSLSGSNVGIRNAMITNNLTIDAGSSSILGYGSLSVGGTTQLTSLAAIVLDNANSFTGTVSISGRNVTLRNTTALEMGLSFVDGNLTLNTTDSNITQTGSMNVSGSSTLNAGTGAITLLDSNNSFTGAVNLTASSIRLYSGSDLTLGSITVPLAGGLVDIQAGGILTLGNQDLSAENLTLASLGASLVTHGNLTALDTLDLSAKTGMTLGHTLTSDVLNLSTDNTALVTGDITAAMINVTKGTLQIGDGNTSGSLSGAVNLTGLTSKLTFNRSDTVTYNGSISGNGMLNQIGSGTLILNGLSTATDTFVNAGSLIIGDIAYSSAYLSSDVHVINNARLGGHGTIKGNVTLANHAILSPGNSIGTLTVDGNINFSSGSVFEVEADENGNSDQLLVSGNAQLNGATLAVTAANGTWAAATPYTLINAGSLTGTFGGVTSNLAFLTPTLSYTGTQVNLLLSRNNVAFASVAETRNQRASSEAIESLGAGSSLVTAISGLDADAARAAYDNLSGEIHASVQSALLDDSRYLREGINDRLLATQGLTHATGVLSTADQGAVFWMQGYGGWARNDGDNNAARLSHDSRGTLFGVDLALNPTWRLGAAVGLGTSDIDAHDRDSSADVDSRSLALYASGQWDRLNLRLGAGRTWNDIDTRRKVNVGVLSERDKASYDATTTQVFSELGYRLPMGALQLEPFVGLAHVQFDSDGIAERGGQSALHGRGEKQDISYTTLGLRGSLPLADVAGIPLTTQGSLAWQHALGNDTPDSRLAFTGSDSFQVRGAAMERDSAVAQLGVQARLNSATSVGLTYSGRAGQDYRDHGLNLGVSLAF